MKRFKAQILSALLMITMITATACNTQQQILDDAQTQTSQAVLTNQQTEGENKNMEEYYIFELNDTVERTAVRYKNRYGIELSADLYTSKELDLLARLMRAEAVGEGEYRGHHGHPLPRKVA